MENTDYYTETKKFGSPLKYDPTFRGPLAKRSCTDVLCLLLFFAFLVGWGGVGYYAFKWGDPKTLLRPTDSSGLRCGIDAKVIDKPYLFFFDLTQCADPKVLLHGCPTPQVCVKECPKENLVFAPELPPGPSKMEPKQLICLYDIDVTSLTEEKAKKLVEEKKCARWYLESQKVSGRCLPKAIKDLTDELFNNTIDIKVLKEGSEIAALLSSTKEMGQKIVQDLSESWPLIVGGLAVAMVICLFYIVLMRWFAGLMVWLSLFGVLALLSVCVYGSYKRYSELKNVEQKEKYTDISAKALTNLKAEVEEILAMKNTWLAFLIISASLLIIILLLLIFLRKRIQLAIALIREASKAVSSITSTLVFPLFPWVLQIVVIAWFVTVLLFLAGSTKPVYKITGMESCNPIFDPVKNITYQDGVVCNPKDFNKMDLNNCKTALCNFKEYEKEKYIDYLHTYNIFGVFWALFFVSALGEMILASAFATWYWTFDKADVPYFTLTVATGRTLRYHLGTIAFGSLILAICRMIRVILEYIDHKLKKYDNQFVKCIMCCLRCCFWCLEKFIRFINHNAYIMCAIHGKNFCRSARDAFNLLMRNIVRVFVLDKVTDFLLFLGKAMITAGMCALAFFLLTKEVTFYNGTIPHLNYSLVPVILIGFGTYFIATIFFGVYSMAVDTLFLCFLEDCERNDGSQEKPYFMSKGLMKILHKKNV